LIDAILYERVCKIYEEREKRKEEEREETVLSLVLTAEC